MNNIGYLFELKSQSEDTYITALQLSYLGRVWTVLSLFLFVAELCRISTPKALKTGFAVFSIVTYIIVFTVRSHELYYTNMSFFMSGDFPKMQHGTGVWHKIFSVMTVFYIVCGLTMLFVTRHKERDKKARKRLMTDALAKNLQKSGFITSICEPEIADIGREREDTDIYLVYSGNFVFEAADVLVYLKDICAEEEKLLCVIGYAKEITEMKNVIPSDLISCEFERPFDMKALTAELKKLSADDEERKKGKHTLLVDDDLTFLKMTQEWLSMKYNIMITRSGMQAITYIANHTPELILLDYDMPIKPGPQVMEMIRSEPNSAQIPIIFLTGKADKESVMTVMQLKPQGYLLKSMSKEQIMESVDHFFETKKWKNAQI